MNEINDTNVDSIWDGLWRPLVIFGFSFLPSLSPSVLLSSIRLKNMYNKASIVSAGLLLAILFVDFIPHLVHPHTHSVEKSSACSHGHQKQAVPHNLGKSLSTLHTHKWYDNLQIALITGGLTLILLIIIDQRVLKHSHCDKEKEGKIEEGIALASMDHAVHGHSHSDAVCTGTHIAGAEYLTKEVNLVKVKASEAEIKGCCTEGLKYKTTIKQALIFIFIFSIHSIFEGFAFTPKLANSLPMFLGLIVHKVLESITVGIALFSSQFKKRITVALLLFYSSLTPIGMIVAYSISGMSDSKILKDIFSGLSFGSLSFIVLVEMLPPIVHSLTNPIKIFYLLFGYAIGSAMISIAHFNGGCAH